MMNLYQQPLTMIPHVILGEGRRTAAEAKETTPA
jgi:hypothetical protein